MNKDEEICWPNQKTVHFCLSQRHKIVIMPKNAFGFSVKCVNVIFCTVCFSKDVVDHALHSQMMFFKRKHRGLSLRPIQTPFTGSVHGQKEQILARTIFFLHSLQSNTNNSRWNTKAFWSKSETEILTSEGRSLQREHTAFCFFLVLNEQLKS